MRGGLDISKLKYLIAGSGGTGGSIGAFLASDGKDVTFIARGEHGRQMSERGLQMKGTLHGDFIVNDLNVSTMEEYNDNPDVIFVCVKGYSLDETTSFISRVATSDTVVIPVLNIYGTGEKMSEQLPDSTVTDGCIYISARISNPGEISHEGTIFKVIFGLRPGQSKEKENVLRQVESDLRDAGIDGILSNEIKRDTFKKFAYVSPVAAAGQYYGADAGVFQKEGEPRVLVKSLMTELVTLAGKMGITFDNDLIKENMKILDSLTPSANTSMQRDIIAGRQSEISGLVYDVPLTAEKYGMKMPAYEKVISKLKDSI